MTTPRPNTNEATPTGGETLCVRHSSFPHIPSKKFKTRFWRRVRITERCWTWLGGTDMNGNGLVKVGASRTTKKARRVAYELTNGPIPEGLGVSVTCKNHACVRPTHLVLRNQTEVIAAATAKGKMAYGEGIGSAKLTQTQVLEIVRLANDGISQRELARRYGMNRHNIGAIVRGRAWGRITGLQPKPPKVPKRRARLKKARASTRSTGSTPSPVSTRSTVSTSSPLSPLSPGSPGLFSVEH